MVIVATWNVRLKMLITELNIVSDAYALHTTVAGRLRIFNHHPTDVVNGVVGQTFKENWKKTLHIQYKENQPPLVEVTRIKRLQRELQIKVYIKL